MKPDDVPELEGAVNILLPDVLLLDVGAVLAKNDPPGALNAEVPLKVGMAGILNPPGVGVALKVGVGGLLELDA